MRVHRSCFVQNTAERYHPVAVLFQGCFLVVACGEAVDHEGAVERQAAVFRVDAIISGQASASPNEMGSMVEVIRLVFW